jgi:rsbT co-antagonist protein RsbR
MTEHATEPEAFREEVYERIADILLVLSAVAAGNFNSRLDVDLPDTDPIGALYNGINQTVSSLAEAQRRTDAYQRELEEKLATIERQQVAIRELSTPVIEVWNGVLCLPIVGIMDSTRSAEMQDALLRAVSEKKARCTIIDITGIEVMDTGTADHFMRMAKAVRLLGAQCYLTGISPAIAQTIVHMGLDLGGVVTYRSLRDALQAYVRSTLRRNNATAGVIADPTAGSPGSSGSRGGPADK